MTSLQSIDDEIQQLECELESANRARVTPEDRHAQELRNQLENKKRELHTQQAAEAAAAAELQRRRRLAQLSDLEQEIDHAKTETLTLRRMLAELPAKLSMAEYQLNLLLRTHSQLKTECRKG